MAATNYSPIQLYYSTTASAAPAAGNLVSGELAINITDGKLYYKDNAGAVQLLSTSTTANGTANGVLYLNGSKVATSGSALVFDGTNLGLGTSSPSSKFVVSNSGAAGFEINPIGSASAPAIYSYNRGTSSYGILTSISSEARWQTGSSPAETMRLDTSGNLGIGTSSPANKLDVQAGFISTYDPTNANGAGYAVRFYTNANSGSRAEVARMGGIQNGAGNNGALIFATSNSGTVDERMRLDSSGNLGLGVTPSAWGSGLKAFQASTASFMGDGTATYVSSNYYYNAGNKYIGNGYATSYQTYNGQHVWLTAGNNVSGAGAAITFTQAMTLDASGRLGIGETSPSNRLSVTGSTGTIASFTNGATADLSIICGASATSLNAGGSNVLAFQTGGSERARIDSSGNFLIGRTSSGVSGYKLQIDGSGGIASSANSAVEFGIRTPDATYNDSYLIFGTPTYNRAAIYCTGSAANTGNLVFTTYNAGSGAERARIDSSGNLLVGTTSVTNSPAEGVQLANGSSIGGVFVGHVNGTATGNYYATFSYNTGIIGSITQNGVSQVLYNISSDQRLKENIADADSASTLIDSLQVRKFDWKSDGSHQRYGFVAQELVTVAPEAVHQPADPEEMMAVDYSKLVPMLVKEIQSLRGRVAQLESN